MRKILLFSIVLTLGLTACSSDGTETTIPVEYIGLFPLQLTLDIGQTGVLEAVILPGNATNQNLVWQSLHPRIATVNDQGVVTTVSPGTATIVVRSIDQGVSAATTTVTVNPRLVTSVSFEGLAMVVIPVGGNQPLSEFILVLPLDASNRNVRWESDDIDIATVSAGGVVTAVAEGTTTITVITVCGEFTDTISIEVVPAEPEP